MHELVAILKRLVRARVVQLVAKLVTARQRRRLLEAELGQIACYPACVPCKQHLQAIAFVLGQSRRANDFTLLAVHERIAILKRMARARPVQLVAGLVTARQRRRLLAAETGQRAVYGAFVPRKQHLQAVALVLAGRGADDLARLAVRELIATLKRLARSREVQLFAGLVIARQRRRLLAAEPGQIAVYGARVSCKQQLQAIALVLAGRRADDLALLAVRERVCRFKRLARSRPSSNEWFGPVKYSCSPRSWPPGKADRAPQAIFGSTLGVLAAAKGRAQKKKCELARAPGGAWGQLSEEARDELTRPLRGESGRTDEPRTIERPRGRARALDRRELRLAPLPGEGRRGDPMPPPSPEESGMGPPRAK